MRVLLSTAGIAALMLGGAEMALAELPTFERNGFPITPHQIQVLGSTQVKEQAPTSTLTMDGMPASPHQLRVLRQESLTTQ